MNKCVFLDRDGVLNVERGNYTHTLQDFKIIEGVKEALWILKEKGYLLIIITNQAGISKGLYTEEALKICHDYLQKEVDNVIDALYFCPYHPDQTHSIARKPASLMFEKAIAKFKIAPLASYMVGDKVRDLIPAMKLGIKTIMVGKEEPSAFADFVVNDLRDALKVIE
jgi:D-glycero-D-manno-heptose 1,7-bisphosphate phosphatase